MHMNLRIRKLMPLFALLIGLLALPAAAQAAQHITWKTDNRLEAVQDSGFTGVSCASTSQCVAVDVSGRVFYTTSPYGKSSAWHAASVDRDDGGQFTGISCPSTRLCVAVDADGFEVHSTNPTGGPKAWTRPVRIDSAQLPGGGYAGLSGISCPSTHLCIATDNSTAGGVMITTDPASTTNQWRRITLGNNVILSTVSCSSTTLCVVGGTREYYSVNPSGPASGWHAGGIVTGGFINSLWCPTKAICVGVGYNGSSTGVALATPRDTGTASAWRRTNIIPDPPGPTQGQLDTVACANAGFCIALDSDDDAYTSLRAAQFRWNLTPQPIRTNPLATRSVITCRGNMCVTLDSRGVEETGTVSG